MKKVTLYTDGACSGNPGPGGWGVLLQYGAVSKEIYGSDPHTTNNRMELQAAIEGLRALKTPCCVDVYTDSQYLKRGVTEWLEGWKAKNWKTSSKKPVKNSDLWQALDIAIADHKIEWHWVEGHAGDPGNEKADALAVRGRDEVMGNES